MQDLVSWLLGGSLGSAITFYYNFRENKRKSHVDSITSQRVEWTKELKKEIPEFIAIIQIYNITSLNERLELRKKLVNLMEHISIKLNPTNDDFDEGFINSMRTVFDNTIDFKVDKDELNRFRNQSQSMVKIEWEGIKLEAKQGDLSKEEKLKLRRKWLV